MTVVDAQMGQSDSSALRSTPTTRVLQRTWREVAEKERELLAGITLTDLVQRLKGAPEGMYYI